MHLMIISYILTNFQHIFVSTCICGVTKTSHLEKQHESYKCFSPSHKLLSLLEFWRRLSEEGGWVAVAVCSVIIVSSWLKQLLAGSALSSSDRWLTRANTLAVTLLFLVRKSPGNCQQDPPPTIYTFTTFIKNRRDCWPLVSIHFFPCLIVRLWPSIVQDMSCCFRCCVMWQLLLAKPSAAWQ